MAKKYNQTSKDRRDESRGMEKRMHRGERGDYGNYGKFVEGHDPMIGRDSFAGLPGDVVMKQYPRSKMSPGSRLDDSMSEIDAIQSDSERQLERRLSHQK